MRTLLVNLGHAVLLGVLLVSPWVAADINQPLDSCQGGRLPISGRVTTAEDAVGLPGITLTLDGPSDCQETATTKGLGLYRFPDLNPGTYTVTPSDEDCTFSPPSRTVTLAEGGRARLNFEASCP
jgi:hypothetical protein